MKKIYTLLFILLTNYGFSQMQFSSVKSFNSSATQLLSTQIVTDNQGNCYVSGTFSGTQTFDTVSIVAKGSTDAYLAKFNATGNCLWVRTYGFSISQTQGTAVGIDAAGNIILAGNYTNYFNIDTSYIVALGQTDLFMVKLDAQGNLIKFITAGGTAADVINDLTTDPQGRFYITGSFAFKCYFGNDSIQTTNLNSFSDIFLTAYDANMNTLWAKRAGGSSDNDYAKSVKYNNNRVLLCGVITGANCTFGTNSVNSYGQSDAFLAKYDLSGNNVWVKRAGSTGNDYCNALSTDSFGNAYIAGTFILNATFGAAPNSFSINAGNAEDIFIAKYDSMGVCNYAKRAGAAAPNSDGAIGIETDSYGYTVITGYYAGNASFTTTNLTSSGLDDGFVAKYDPIGTCQYALKAGGSGFDRGMSVSLSTFNNLYYVVGTYTGTATFSGGISLTSTGPNSNFIATIPGFYAGLNELQIQTANNLVYPNPANDVLKLNADYEQKAQQLEVFDLLGNRIFFTNHVNENFEIKTNTWANGVYTVKVLQSNVINVMKVIIAH
jgi:hypothetical protein